MDSDPAVPTATADKVSGLPNGTYFLRVKATQLVGGATGSVDSPWSTTRSFTVTGLGPAPAAPAFTGPVNNAQFHLLESFKLNWSAVAGAQYYILEADDDPGFSYPLVFQQAPLVFGTQFGQLWGNAIPSTYYRVRAVSADGVRSLPSATTVVHITDAAPVPPAVTQVAPANGGTATLPFVLDWSDTPNPQIPGYDLEINTSAAFPSSSSRLLVSPSRSDYLITPNLLAPGSYFWRVRALHGNVGGPWSAARSITVQAGPATPNVGLFAIIAEPINGYGGNAVQARVMLDDPAPAGGKIVALSTDIPQVQLPQATVTVPAGRTEAQVTSIATGPVPNNGLSIGIIGDLFAGDSAGSAQSSLGVLPILYGTGLSRESIVGGTSFTGIITLQGPAPAGGVTVSLASSDTALVRPPPTVTIPAGATDATFTIATSAVSVPTRVTIDTGTNIDGYRAPQNNIVVTPAGSAPPPASLAALSLNQSSAAAGNSVNGTVTLTAPAPAGGAVVTLQGSLNGQVVVPPNVTVPAGSTSATFTTKILPPVHTPQWVFVGAHFGTSGGSQARILEVDPSPGAPTLLGIGPASQDVIGGRAGRATVALVMAAPVAGANVSLSTDNPSAIQVPASVTIPEGNSTISFAINTSPVSGLATGGNVFASAGGVTKSIFVNVSPDPNAQPLLRSLSISPASVPGGTSATGTVNLNAPAPSSGASITLATSNRAAAQVPGIVNVPAGQTSAAFPVTTFAVSASTTVAITAFFDTTATATVAVTSGSAPNPTPSGTLAAPAQVSPAADARIAPGANITFDWSDVSGGTAYTIQIDDQNNFSSPIVDQNVTPSQFSTNILPTATMWWRVRATNASGPGAWSGARRFEIKN